MLEVTVIADLLALMFTLLGVVGGTVFAVILTVRNARQQRDTDNDKLEAERGSSAETFRQQQTRLLNERFTAAAAQLGHDQAAVRLAGVYAMAALADDFSHGKDLLRSQMCIDILCRVLAPTR
jgi:hypothetical protein